MASVTAGLEMGIPEPHQLRLLSCFDTQLRVLLRQLSRGMSLPARGAEAPAAARQVDACKPQGRET